MRRGKFWRIVKWVGILSDSETDCAFRCHREGITYCCEAVAHFGGTVVLMRRAADARHNTALLKAIGVLD